MKLPWLLFALTCAFAALDPLFLVLSWSLPMLDTWAFRGHAAILALAFGSVGLFLALNRRQNPIGWLFLVAGFVSSMYGFGIEYSAYVRQAQFDALAERYRFAPPPAQGTKATMWYRIRLLTHDWSENWSRLTLYQGWRSKTNEKLDGTNNASEQVIGHCVKERYRTMRGYKRNASTLNVSSLIGWVLTKGPDYAMTESVQG